MAERIQCRSRRSTENLFVMIEESVSKTFRDCEDIDSYEKQRVFERFKEIYFGSLKSNIVIDGVGWEETSCDETAEYKPIDMEKKKYVDTTLVELVDDSIIRVSSRRKKYPSKLTINCRKMLEARTVQCVKRKFQLPNMKVCNHTVAEKIVNPIRMENLAESCKVLATQIKTVPNALIKTERLKKSTEMFENHKMTLPNGVLFNDSEVIPHEDSSLQSKLLVQLQ
ncbi:uncharacterized protein LOC133183054 [Saccostrea echinata]|uniref:uncharacterized protein LOC133183054 n=1 Tax=Saccostrea echinata TaxID=191078 RepID=UPI002A834513|nr:uncharacterized protein LOC133183054 [Saccostrea echinata]